MKTIIKILIILTTVVSLISIYWIIARYTDLINDDLLEKGNWGNVNPIMTLLTGLISITILLISLRYFKPIFQTLKLSKTIKIGFLASLFFILIATMFWSDSWTDRPSDVLDSRELGDGIWKLGHPLTFLIIDLPIYLRHKNDGLQNFWSDFWAYPSVLTLFVIQFSVYVQGLRMIINAGKIKTAYNKISKNMKQLYFIVLIFTIGIVNAQDKVDSIAVFDNSQLEVLRILIDSYQCSISPFSKGENPTFSDDREFKIKTTLFAEEGKEIELPETPDSYRLEVHANTINLNLSDSTIKINGYVKGGWYGAKSHVHIYIGQKVDTVMDITLAPTPHGPIYYNGKKVKEPIILQTLPAFRLSEYSHVRSEVGFKDHKKRAYTIKAKIDDNSILVFGLSSSYVEIFEVGNLLE